MNSSMPCRSVNSSPGRELRIGYRGRLRRATAGRDRDVAGALAIVETSRAGSPPGRRGPDRRLRPRPARHRRHAPGGSRHRYADPCEAPGERDLTAHVDFPALAAARERGVRDFGPVAQGDWLEAMGIQLRAASLAKAAPERGGDRRGARPADAPSQMGRCSRCWRWSRRAGPSRRV
jgi:NADH dehydrogenase [ubiquinone] 1 alpha subcomplex assembly factor 7